MSASTVQPADYSLIQMARLEVAAAGVRTRVDGALHFHTDEAPALEPNSVAAIEP